MPQLSTLFSIKNLLDSLSSSFFFIFLKMASFVILAAILMGIFSTSSANDFTISWVQNPKESFNTWASRMRFQVNDKLGFKYNKAEDSVLVVKKEDYDACNVKTPIQKLEDSSFQLTRSGPYYFISGVEEKCSKGEKLIVVVLAERNKKPVIPKPPTSPSTTPPPSSSPSLKPPTQSPTPPSSMAPSVSPPTSSMAPSVSSSPPPASSMAPSISSSPPPASSLAPSVSSSPSSSMAPGTNSQSPSSSSVSPMQAPSSFNAGNEPVAAPTPAQNAKSSATALTASSLTIVMGAIIILGQALLLG